MVPRSTNGSPASTPTGSTGSPAAARCLVRLHGKGGAGGEEQDRDGTRVVAPDGNAEGWGGRQWLYFPEDRYEGARDLVAAAIDGCDEVIVNGFSNGAAFAAKLYCRGERCGGRVVGVVIDDPVVDGAVEGCAPDPAVAATVYWTGALEETVQPGWDCTDADWTCEGGTTIGLEAWSQAIGLEISASPFDEHEWHVDAPELTQW